MYPVHSGASWVSPVGEGEGEGEIDATGEATGVREP